MELSRRTFLKISGATTAGAILGGLGVNLLKPKDSYAQPLKIKYAKETTTICPYCGVGCGLIVSAKDGKVVNTEGDPDHPINMGSLCSKGAALSQIADNGVSSRHGGRWPGRKWENIRNCRPGSRDSPVSRGLLPRNRLHLG